MIFIWFLVIHCLSDFNLNGSSIHSKENEREMITRAKADKIFEIWKRKRKTTTPKKKTTKKKTKEKMKGKKIVTQMLFLFLSTCRPVCFLSL